MIVAKVPRHGQVLILRILVHHPVDGVELCVQLGRDELMPPIAHSTHAITFEIEIEAQTRPDGSVAFRGPAAQGPASARFIYINTGTYAGQRDSPWGTRVKVPLTNISGALVAEAMKRPGMAIVGEIDGRGRKGGPAAATVPLLGDGWRLE